MELLYTKATVSHRFRCAYAFCLDDTGRERLRNRVDLKTLPNKSEAFSKRYGLIFYVNSKTASISIRLLFWREFSCIIRFRMVNLAHIAALAYTSTTSIFWRRRFRVNIPDHIDFDAVSKS